MSFDVERAIRNIERREHLREAEVNAQWVIRRSKMRRIRSKTECETRVRDSASCLHGTSYTLACGKCKRDKRSADINLANLRRKLSIT